VEGAFDRGAAGATDSQRDANRLTATIIEASVTRGAFVRLVMVPGSLRQTAAPIVAGALLVIRAATHLVSVDRWLEHCCRGSGGKSAFVDHGNGLERTGSVTRATSTPRNAAL
jgi:hypothetical protein